MIRDLVNYINTMGPVDITYPNTLDDVTPSWSALGLGEHANPKNYRQLTTADDFATKIVHLLQALVQRHLLILGNVNYLPKQMCYYMLGMKRGTAQFDRHIPSQGYAGLSWPSGNHYQWDQPNVNQDDKRKAMRLLFISMNQFIQVHYPNQIIPTIGGRLVYG